MKGYPRRFVALVYLSLAVMLVSGLMLVPTFLDMRLEMDVPWRPDFALRSLFAMVHTGDGLVVLWFIGALWSVHMRGGWRRHRNRWSGALLMAMLGLLAVSCLGIFYAGDEQWSLWFSLVHVLVGLALVMPGLIHVLLWRLRGGWQQ